ncbi:MAG: septum formation initiator [Winogradskyella sp.]|nr:septum formation initiator family protein [Winogradskyella sp.]MBT8375684.1 septum formation initiator family protein [Bacteroidia bacterium]NNC46611.1 septum formation initiator [Winogradskyella sp.]NNF86239.1 septum formation initiator [Winogradskyella sp.]NNK40023.1 septum formation initiator [Winogradskyella sp.]
MKISSKFIKPFKNIYILILTVFVIWMLFFDAHSWLFHHELNQDIKEKEAEKAYYINEIEKDKKAVKELSTEDGTERLAREKYFMKKKNEDIFIIEYEDSIKKSQSND